MTYRPELLAYALAALCACLITFLIATDHPAPDVLEYLAVAAVGGGAGVSVGRSAPRRSNDKA